MQLCLHIDFGRLNLPKYRNEILQNIAWHNSMRLKSQISTGQIHQIYGAFRCPIFEFFEKLFPYVDLLNRS